MVAIVDLTAYIASAKGFYGQSKVVNETSKLLKREFCATAGVGEPRGGPGTAAGGVGADQPRAGSLAGSSARATQLEGVANSKGAAWGFPAPPLMFCCFMPAFYRDAA